MKEQAFFVGSGVELGTAGASAFSGLTGLYGAVGAATDPGATHGFR